ncbi:EAL domain-containing protein [Eubacterium sp. 1001713B170207_170306_E7]|uniref:EAL domain-containing protein n=1 Tax=Eubacterium sp. 1001713B170207_170306_E7 TaxID=2787097 RepID=UPI00189C3A66|nr:EAL domain-containing protein [Eubacterium sp. 1001713B170207_170306_E7]
MKRQILQKHSPKEQNSNRFYFTLLRILILVFVAMLIGSVVLTYFFNLDTYQDNLRRQTETSEAMLADTIDHLGDETLYLSNSKSIATLLESGTGIAASEAQEKEAIHVVEEAVKLMPNYVGIRVLGKDNQAYLKNTELQFVDELDMGTTENNPDSFQNEPYRVCFTTYKNEAVVEVCAPVWSEGGTYLGCVSLYYDNDFINLPDDENEWGAVLFDSDSWMPVATKGDLSLSKANEKINSCSGLLEGMIETENKQESFTYFNPDGQRMLGFVVRDTRYPMALMTSVNSSTIFRTVLEYSAYQIVLTIILLLVFGFALYLFYSRMKRPLREMRERCQRMSDGEEELDFGQYNDHDLNALSDSLSSYCKKLEKAAFEDFHLSVANFSKGYQDIQRLIRKKEPFTIYMLDVADFGKYNRIFSVETGNAILLSISQGLEKIFGDRSYHVYGDRFMGINAMQDGDDGIQLELQKLMDSEITVGAASFQLKYKIGICRYPEHGGNAKDLVINLWHALSFSKKYSEESAVVYNQAVFNDMEREKKILELLNRQIELQDFDVWYQPVYNYRKQCYTMAEALMRLQDENGQYIPPYEAIRIAEKHNLVTEVGELVLSKACQTMKFLSDQGTSIESITVNLSVQQLVDQNYGKKTLNIIRESGITPDQICVEITEALLLQSFPAAIDVLNQMHAAGICIIMDNFGSGEGSISYFSQVPFAFVKLDHRLVQQVQQNQEQFEFVRKMIEMIKIREVRVVAERVETEKDLNWMIRCGADYVQGYYYSKPLEEEEFWELLKKKD